MKFMVLIDFVPKLTGNNHFCRDMSFEIPPCAGALKMISYKAVHYTTVYYIYCSIVHVLGLAMATRAPRVDEAYCTVLECDVMYDNVKSDLGQTDPYWY